jgi:hypothetical protein
LRWQNRLSRRHRARVLEDRYELEECTLDRHCGADCSRRVVEVRQLDAKQEERYETCFAQRDKEIHDVAFATIDNPDVQKLYISNNRDLAVAECRAQFPKHWTVVDAPSRFKLIDLRFRF